MLKRSTLPSTFASTLAVSDLIWYSRGAKPVQLFVQKEESASDGEGEVDEDIDTKEQTKMRMDVDEDENPF